MSSNSYSNSTVDGVTLARSDLETLLRIMRHSASQGLPPGQPPAKGSLTLKLSRGHNTLEFDSTEEMDTVIQEFPEWRHPDSLDISLMAFSYGFGAGGVRNKDFSRIISARIKRKDACHVYASGDNTRWGLTTGSLVESHLRKLKSWRRFNRQWAILMVALLCVSVMPLTVGTLWFLIPGIGGILTCTLLMAGMPLGSLLYRNKISLGK